MADVKIIESEMNNLSVMSIRNDVKSKDEFYKLCFDHRTPTAYGITKKTINKMKAEYPKLYQKLIQDMIKDGITEPTWKIICTYITPPKSCSRTGKAIANEDNFIKRFNDDESYKNTVCRHFGVTGDPNDWEAVKPTKEYGYKIVYTPNWKKYKIGTKETNRKPKTDIVLRNRKTGQCIRISLKSGKGRVTSGDRYETRALMKSVLDSNENIGNETRLKVGKLIDLLDDTEKFKCEMNETNLEKRYKTNKSTLTPELCKWYESSLSIIKQLNQVWLEIMEDTEFVHLVARETYSGLLKFGEDNIGKADFIIETKGSSSLEIEKCFSTKLDNETFHDACKIAINNSPFAFKSSRYKTTHTIWIRFC